MNEDKFQVSVDGTLVPGIDREQAKANVAKMFKTTPDKIAALFSGSPVVVKKDVDEVTATKYKMILGKAGLVAKIISSGLEEATTEPATRPPEERSKNHLDVPSAGLKADIAEAGSVIDPTPPTPAADIDTSGITMAQAGEELPGIAPPPEPEIDTSHFSMEAAGSTLDDTPMPTPPEIKTGHISIGEVGETLVEHAPPPPADIADIGAGLAEPGATIDDLPPPPPKEIDTSKLKLSDDE